MCHVVVRPSPDRGGWKGSALCRAGPEPRPIPPSPTPLKATWGLLMSISSQSPPGSAPLTSVPPSFIFAMGQPMPLFTGQVLALVVTSRVSTPILGLEESHPAEKTWGLAAPHLFCLCRWPKQCCRRSGSPQVRNVGWGKKCSSGPCCSRPGSLILHMWAFW